MRLRRWWRREDRTLRGRCRRSWNRCGCGERRRRGCGHGEIAMKHLHTLDQRRRQRDLDGVPLRRLSNEEVGALRIEPGERYRGTRRAGMTNVFNVQLQCALSVMQAGPEKTGR